MANYEDAEGIVVKYAIIPPGTYAVTVKLKNGRDRDLHQKYELSFVDFDRYDIREGTKVSLRLNTDHPYLSGGWKVVKWGI